MSLTDKIRGLLRNEWRTQSRWRIGAATLEVELVGARIAGAQLRDVSSEPLISREIGLCHGHNWELTADPCAIAWPPERGHLLAFEVVPEAVGHGCIAFAWMDTEGRIATIYADVIDLGEHVSFPQARQVSSTAGGLSVVLLLESATWAPGRCVKVRASPAEVVWEPAPASDAVARAGTDTSVLPPAARARTGLHYIGFDAEQRQLLALPSDPSAPAQVLARGADVRPGGAPISIDDASFLLPIQKPGETYGESLRLLQLRLAGSRLAVVTACDIDFPNRPSWARRRFHHLSMVRQRHGGLSRMTWDLIIDGRGFASLAKHIRCRRA